MLGEDEIENGTFAVGDRLLCCMLVYEKALMPFQDGLPVDIARIVIGWVRQNFV